MHRHVVTRLERLESKTRQQCGRSLRLIVDDDDPAKEKKIAAFTRENGLTDNDRLIVRVIVRPPQ